MPDVSNDNSQPKSAPKKITHPGVLAGWMVLGVLVIVIIGGLVFFLYDHSGSSGKVDVQAIRRLFAPRQNNSSPVQKSSVTSSTLPLVSNPLTRGPQSLPQRPSASTTPTYSTYTNQGLGFEMQISSAWQFTEAGDGHTVVFTNAQGQNISVQSYPVTNQTLATIQTQLQGSPSVQNLRTTTFQGQSALVFDNVLNRTQGLAVIYHNRLFYIMAPSLTQPPVSSFGFLE